MQTHAATISNTGECRAFIQSQHSHLKTCIATQPTTHTLSRCTCYYTTNECLRFECVCARHNSTNISRRRGKKDGGPFVRWLGWWKILYRQSIQSIVNCWMIKTQDGERRYRTNNIDRHDDSRRSRNRRTEIVQTKIDNRSECRNCRAQNKHKQSSSSSSVCYTYFFGFARAKRKKRKDSKDSFGCFIVASIRSRRRCGKA